MVEQINVDRRRTGFRMRLRLLGVGPELDMPERQLYWSLSFSKYY